MYSSLLFNTPLRWLMLRNIFEGCLVKYPSLEMDIELAADVCNGLCIDGYGTAFVFQGIDAFLAAKILDALARYS